MNDFESQIRYTKQELEIAEGIQDNQNIKSAASNLFITYLRNNDFERAKYYNAQYDLGYQSVINAKLKGDTNYINIMRFVQIAE